MQGSVCCGNSYHGVGAPLPGRPVHLPHVQPFAQPHLTPDAVCALRHRVSVECQLIVLLSHNKTTWQYGITINTRTHIDSSHVSFVIETIRSVGETQNKEATSPDQLKSPTLLSPLSSIAQRICQCPVSKGLAGNFQSFISLWTKVVQFTLALKVYILYIGLYYIGIKCFFTLNHWIQISTIRNYTKFILKIKA